MAVAVTQVERKTVFGDRRILFATLTFSSNYATGGESLTPAMLGMKRLDYIGFSGPAVSTDRATADVPGYDYTTNKVLFYQTGTSANDPLNEKGAEAYITGCSVRVMAVGV